LGETRAARLRRRESFSDTVFRRGRQSPVRRRKTATTLSVKTGGDDWKERLTSEHEVEFSWADLLQESLEPLGGPKAIRIEGDPADNPEALPSRLPNSPEISASNPL
jgi:hypothetical protein